MFVWVGYVEEMTSPVLAESYRQRFSVLTNIQSVKWCIAYPSRHIRIRNIISYKESDLDFSSSRLCI